MFTYMARDKCRGWDRREEGGGYMQVRINNIFIITLIICLIIIKIIVKGRKDVFNF